jgi:hypothetical protein
MSSMMSRILLAALVVAAGLNFSCSSSDAPQPGTPPYYWAAAKEAFAAGDYDKTSQHLDKLLASENEFTARALAWRLVLTSGTIRGYMDVADNLELAVRAKRSDPGQYRKYISNSRSSAGRLSLQFAELFMRFQKGKDDPVLLAFAYPSGTAAPVPELTKALAGMPLQTTELDAAGRHAVERAILLETCRVAGAPDDTAKTSDLFKSGNVQIPRATFLAGLANSLYEQSQLYNPKKLDDPQKLKVFSDLALDALKGVPEDKAKVLTEKIKKGMKKK